MALAEILKAFMKKNGITAETIANQMGVTKGAVIHWSNGIRKPKMHSQYQKLAKLLNIDIENLIDSKILDDAEIAKIIPLTRTNDKATTNVGVLEMVAGFGTEGVLDVNFKIDYELCLPKEFLGKIPAKHARIIRCLGDSMEPEFQNGDYLLVEMLDGRYFIKREGIYLVRVGEIVYIKRVLFLPNGDAKLISINPSYGIIQPIKDLGYEYEILGAVYGKISVKLGSGFQFDNQGIK